MRLYISGFSPLWGKEDLEKLCKSYGKVVYTHIRKEVHAPDDFYAVVEYNLSVCAHEAKMRLDGAIVGGYILSVRDSPPARKAIK